MKNKNHSWTGFQGRRLGRPLGAKRQKAMDVFYPALAIKPEHITEDRALSPDLLFPEKHNTDHCEEKKHTILEIGFGNGEHLYGLIQQNKEHINHAYIGVEPFVNGMAAFLSEFEHMPENLRVYNEDAIPLLYSLSDTSIDEIYVLNPDPWPKKRHHKRRIINADTLHHITRILKPGGTLTMTTDVDDLAEWMVTQTFIHSPLRWLARKSQDFLTPPENWIKTRYEQKGQREDRKQYYLIFRKN